MPRRIKSATSVTFPLRDALGTATALVSVQVPVSPDTGVRAAHRKVVHSRTGVGDVASAESAESTMALEASLRRMTGKAHEGRVAGMLLGVEVTQREGRTR